MPVQLKNGKESESISSKYPIVNNHIFSFDFTLSSSFPIEEYDQNIYWNKLGMKFFEPITDVCIPIYQGVAMSMHLEETGKNIAFILRRSSLNTGLRFQKRGVDKTPASANDCICDIIFSDNDRNIKSNCFIRGTIPIKWHSVFNPTSTPDHFVDDICPELFSQYFINQKIVTKAQKILILSLLNPEPDSKEHNLEVAYRRAAEASQSRVDFPIYYNNINFKDIMKKPEGYDLFKEIMDSKIDDGDFTTNNGVRQKTVVRINCADSLDRTNVASFFYGIYCCQKCHFFDDESMPYFIDGEALNFLANAFIHGGDLVSMMYTLTPAVHAGIIQKMAGIKQRSDIMINLSRSGKNWASESYWEKVFDTFCPDPLTLEGIKYNSLYFLDPNSVGVFPEFWPIDNQRILNSNETINLRLPFEVCVKRIHILRVPQDFAISPIMSIYFGNDEDSMRKCIETPLPVAHTPSWFIYEFKEHSCLFIKMQFKNKTSFQIGGIRIEVE